MSQKHLGFKAYHSTETITCLTLCYFKNEKAAQRVGFGAGYPADVHADIPADVRGQKLRSNPRDPGKKKNKHFGADIHDPKARTPGGFKKHSVRKTSG